MCGVLGCLVFKNSSFSITEPFMRRMRDTMVHRGPDGAGTWIAPNGRVGLAHRRLSIVDLSEAAAQPMSNEDDALWISFNGEIYNHGEIREQLERTGRHRWKTNHSDTEVILHAFEEWGIDCIEKLRGMFAFALWDARTRELWLVRDRIGIKPLYYSIHHGRITFASEIKALLEDPDQNRAADEEMFFHYLSFLVAPAPFTMFEGIKKLRPGSWLRIREDGSVQEHQYWDVLDHTIPLTDVSEAEVADRVLAALEESVRLRKMSDVPIGVFLSGGVDSSTNTALFSRGESVGVKTFTIGYEGEYAGYQNELHYARMMARSVGAAHHERLLRAKDFVEFIPTLVYLQDEPLGDPVCFPTYHVAKLARDNGVVVCQVGEGADELFCGYEGWRAPLHLQWAARWPVPRALKRLGLSGLKLAGRENTHYYEWLHRAVSGRPIFWGGVDGVPETQKAPLLSARLRHRFKSLSSWEILEPIHRRFQSKAWERTPLQWMSYVDLNVCLPELLLMRIDKMTMGVSLEARVPFLDHKFVELAMSIPEVMKFKNGSLKYILKKAVRGVIPDELIDRKKQGFHTPVNDWFLGDLGDVVRRELDEFCSQTDLIDRDVPSRLLKEGRAMPLWFLLNYALWWKRYIKGDPDRAEVA